jgi:hypothetical protein
MTKGSYAGDLTPQNSWEVLKLKTRSNLVDVRTDAEYSFVGVVDISSLRKTLLM